MARACSKLDSLSAFVILASVFIICAFGIVLALVQPSEKHVAFLHFGKVRFVSAPTALLQAPGALAVELTITPLGTTKFKTDYGAGTLREDDLVAQYDENTWGHTGPDFE